MTIVVASESGLVADDVYQDNNCWWFKTKVKKVFRHSSNTIAVGIAGYSVNKDLDYFLDQLFALTDCIYSNQTDPLFKKTQIGKVELVKKYPHMADTIDYLHAMCKTTFRRIIIITRDYTIPVFCDGNDPSDFIYIFDKVNELYLGTDSNYYRAYRTHTAGPIRAMKKMLLLLHGNTASFDVISRASLLPFPMTIRVES